MRMLKRYAGAAALAGALAVLSLVASARRVMTLAADPTGDKDCGPDVGPAPGYTLAAPSPDVDLEWKQRGGTVNDSSCLNRTPVYGIVRVRRVEDVRHALEFARANGLKVSVAGVRHSQGGQAFSRSGIVLDMTSFNGMSLDAPNKVLHVQSGARWHDIQSYLHPRFAVKAMQSTDIFTVGGSISVNAHGMDHKAGSVGQTILAMRVMLPDGRVVTASREENSELFKCVVGGYGLFGVVLDVDLAVTDNAVYRSERLRIGYTEFPQLFDNTILPDNTYALLYGHLSTSPGSLLDEMIVYSYRTTDGPAAEIPPLGDVTSVKLRRAVFNLSKLGGPAMRLKWWMEKYVEPRIESCELSRNQALGMAEGCFVSRNEPMHDSVYYLKNSLPGETDILHEYFIPRARFVEFVDGLRAIVIRDRANLLNASVRVVHRDDNFLTYAAGDAFAFVLYLNQRTDAAGNEAMRTLTRDLIDLTNRLGGRFFLPYQLHYTPEQLHASYPQIGDFFAAKRRVDPDGLLTSTFYDTYAPAFVKNGAP